MGNFVQHEPCPECDSSDGLARYDDNSAHCFVCKHNIQGDGERVTELRDDDHGKDFTPVEGYVQALQHRGITEATCERWRYKVGEYRGSPAHIMECRDENRQLIAQKFRTKNEKGLWQGKSKNPPLFGKWLWPSGGKFLTITEGEIDAMSMSQANGLKYAVVSLPNGTGSLAQVIKRDYEYICSFETVVLMFDMDGPGREAAEKACGMLPSGKVKIAQLPHKDANETLLQEGPGALVKAFWDAERWKPEGIVNGTEFTKERLKKACKAGYEMRYPVLNAKLMGLRKGEITMLTAGSGVGKSTLARELAYALNQDHGCKIGNIYLEETIDTTAQAYVAIHNNVPLAQVMFKPEVLTDAQWDEGLRAVVHNGMWFYDHFGSLASDDLLSKMNFLAKVEGVDFIVLDHVSIVTSGLESSSEGERKDIDILMTRLSSFTQETGCGVIAIVHLKRTQGTSFNEGGQISLSDFRGSAALEQLSHNAVALERDQQEEEAGKKDVSLARVLKCRITGDTGEADSIRYDRKTGRLEVASPFEAVSAFDPHTTDMGDDIPF